MSKKVSRLFALFILLGALFVVSPVRGTSCAEQVFAGSTLQFTITGAPPYKPVPSEARTVLQTIFACPITQPIVIDKVQSLGFLVDADAMVVWTARGNAPFYYVHRTWKVYPISREQWGNLIGMLMPKRIN